MALALPAPTEFAPEPTRTTPLLVALPARPRIPQRNRAFAQLAVPVNANSWLVFQFVKISSFFIFDTIQQNALTVPKTEVN